VVPVRTLPNLPAYPGPNPFIEMPFGGEVGGVPFHITLRLVRTARAWLCFCPQCSRRVGVLYFPPGSAEPGCRACLRLVYESQYEYTPAWADCMRAVARWYEP
jgi:hypothetical protein